MRALCQVRLFGGETVWQLARAGPRVLRWLPVAGAPEPQTSIVLLSFIGDHNIGDDQNDQGDHNFLPFFDNVLCCESGDIPTLVPHQQY